ncbi:MAG: CDP-alcohol phosphatidyltransferase family protein [Bacteroidales bacterium]|nr:CDP-alcohol phosphatidyltransferase family protein [Bacteroidales bacterium]
MWHYDNKIAFSVQFYILYLLCGFSDMIDGTVARWTNSISESGARFDTVADFIFVIVSLIKFLPSIHIPRWLWIWIIMIAILKISNTCSNSKRIFIDFIWNSPHYICRKCPKTCSICNLQPL